MDMFAGIFEDLSSSVKGVGDYFSRVGENIKLNSLSQGGGMASLGKAAKEIYKAPNISQDEGLIPMGEPGIMNPKQAGQVEGRGAFESAPYHQLEDRWTRRIQAFGSEGANPKSGEVSFESIRANIESKKTEKTLKILTEGMK